MRTIILTPRPAGRIETRALLHEDGKPVAVGDTVTSFRGEKATVTGWAQNGRNRVYIRWADGSGESEYFVSVFDLKWADEA